MPIWATKSNSQINTPTHTTQAITMAAFGRFLEDDREVKSYLESFGVRGLDDVDALGIKGPYRRDFERLYLGKPIDD